METRNCVACHQPLPTTSKLTLVTVPRDEAEQNGWPGRENPDGTLTIDMCLQCQIQRSNSHKQRSAPAE